LGNYPFAVSQAKNTENFDDKIGYQIHANRSLAIRYCYHAANGSANAFAAFLLDLPNQVGHDL